MKQSHIQSWNKLNNKILHESRDKQKMFVGSPPNWCPTNTFMPFSSSFEQEQKLETSNLEVGSNDTATER